MSVLDYCVMRVVWDPARGGGIIRGGQFQRLQYPPDLGRGPVYAVDWVPSSIARVSRSVSEPECDMEPDEIAAARRLLEGPT